MFASRSDGALAPARRCEITPPLTGNGVRRVDAEKQRRIAENESVFREINERLGDGHRRFELEGPMEFVCECGDAGCSQRIRITLDEYEELRRDPTRFAVVAGHEIVDVERVVAANERFAVVEKHPGEQKIARERDPRS